MTGARQMVWRLAGAVALALLVMAGCSALTPGAPGERPRSTSPAPVALPGPPMAGASTWVLAVISDAPTVLARLDPRSLRPLPGRRVDLGEPVAGYALSADRSLLVLGDNDQATLVVVDVAGMRLAGRVLLEPGGQAPYALAWLGPRRVAAVTEDAGGASVVLVDPLARRVVARRRLGGVLGGAARLPGRLVLLLTPDGAIGPARLAVVDGHGTVRAVTLPGIVAGFQQPVPSGAQLLDTRSWTVRPLDTQASQVSYRGGWLLTFGGGWNGAGQRWHGAGLAVYQPGGRPPLHLFGTRFVADARVNGDLAYAWLTDGNGDTATAIVDLRTGRALRMLAGPAALPYLLPGEDDDSTC